MYFFKFIGGRCEIFENLNRALSKKNGWETLSWLYNRLYIIVLFTGNSLHIAHTLQ